ncbi:hypothetical protein BC831DRAFT_451170 [Entophlyctis helioformis]|nr:hypothetical protein BC831DRAFT_451170 [Entophlyctis helioformis]
MPAGLGASPTRWVVLVHLALALVGNYYVYDIPTALNRQLNVAMGVDKAAWQTDLAMSYSLYAMPNILLPFVSALIVDRLGTHNAMVVLSLCIVSGSVIFSLGVQVGSMSVLLFGRFVLGLAGDTLGVAQARLTCNWFAGPELALALGINLSAARLGSVLNDILSPVISTFPNPGFEQTPEQQRVGTLIACWTGTLLCVLSGLAAVVVIAMEMALQGVSNSTTSSFSALESPSALLGGGRGNRPNRAADEQEYDPNEGFEYNDADRSWHVRRLTSRDFVGHRTSSQHLLSSRIYTSKASGSVIHVPTSSAASSPESAFARPQPTYRRWWSTSADNVAYAGVGPHRYPHGSRSIASASLSGGSPRNARHPYQGGPGVAAAATASGLGLSVFTAADAGDALRGASSAAAAAAPISVRIGANAGQPGANVRHSTVRNSWHSYDSRADHAANAQSPPQSHLGQADAGSQFPVHRRPSHPRVIATQLAQVPEDDQRSFAPQAPPDGAYTPSLLAQEAANDLLMAEGPVFSIAGIWSDIGDLPVEFWLLSSLMVVYYSCTIPFINILGDDLQNWSYFIGDAQRAGWLLALPDLVSILLVPVCGAIVERKGRRLVLLSVCGLGLVVVHGLFALPDYKGTYGLVILGFSRIIAVSLLGVLYAFHICIFWPLIAFIVNDEDLQGTAYAMSTSQLNMGLAIMPLVVARLITTVDSFSDYTLVHYISEIDQEQQHLYSQIEASLDGYRPDDGVVDNGVSTGRGRYLAEDAQAADVHQPDASEGERDWVRSRQPGFPPLLDDVAHSSSSKLSNTARWLEYGTMYGTIVDDERGFVVRSEDDDYGGLNGRRDVATSVPVLPGPAMVGSPMLYTPPDPDASVDTFAGQGTPPSTRLPFNPYPHYRRHGQQSAPAHYRRSYGFDANGLVQAEYTYSVRGSGAWADVAGLPPRLESPEEESNADSVRGTLAQLLLAPPDDGGDPACAHPAG